MLISRQVSYFLRSPDTGSILVLYTTCSAGKRLVIWLLSTACSFSEVQVIAQPLPRYHLFNCQSWFAVC